MGRTTSDRDQFVELFWQHGAAVHAYLSRRAGRQDADDLLGEVWLQAFRSRERYDRRWPSVLPWLYGIARNVLRAHWRAGLSIPSPAQSVDSHDPWPSVDERLDAASGAGEIRAALDRLSPPDREVLLLVAWEQLRPAEVAIALDLRQGTVRSRLLRTRTHLRQHLDLPTNDAPRPALVPVRLAEACDD